MVDVSDIDVQQHKQKEEAKCHEHVDKVLELFCNECNCAVCYICCATSHFQHKCLGLPDVDKKFVEQIRHEIEKGVKIENFYCSQLASLNLIIKELENDCAQKLAEVKLSISKVRQENEKCFTLVTERIDKCERDAEDSLEKIKKEETVRLENIVASIKEKLVIQQQQNLDNEQYLSPFASVFQRAEACCTLSLTKKDIKDENFIPSIEKFKIPPMPILKYSYDAIFSTADETNGSIKFKNSFVVSELSDDGNGITTLSVNSNKIIVSSYSTREKVSCIYSYSTDGLKLLDFNDLIHSHLMSAMWINNCQFFCTCSILNKNAWIASETGIFTTVPLALKLPQCVYVSLNNADSIYVADWYDGL